MSKLSSITKDTVHKMRQSMYYWMQEGLFKHFFNAATNIKTWALSGSRKFCASSLIDKHYNPQIQNQFWHYGDDIPINNNTNDIPINNDSEQQDIDGMQSLIDDIFPNAKESIHLITEKINKKRQKRYDSMQIPWKQNVLAIKMMELFITQKISIAEVDSLLSIFHELSQKDGNYIKEILAGTHTCVGEGLIFMNYEACHGEDIYAQWIPGGEFDKKPNNLNGKYEQMDFQAPMVDPFKRAIADLQSEPHYYYHQWMKQQKQCNEQKMRQIAGKSFYTNFCQSPCNKNLFWRTIGQYTYNQNYLHPLYMDHYFPGYILRQYQPNGAIDTHYLIWWINNGVISLPVLDKNGQRTGYKTINIAVNDGHIDEESIKFIQNKIKPYTKTKLPQIDQTGEFNPILTLIELRVIDENNFKIVGITDNNSFKIAVIKMNLVEMNRQNYKYVICHTTIGNVTKKSVIPEDSEFDDIPTYKIARIEYVKAAQNVNLDYICVDTDKNIINISQNQNMDNDINIQTSVNDKSEIEDNDDIEIDIEIDDNNIIVYDDVIKGCFQLRHYVQDVFWFIFECLGIHPIAQMRCILINVWGDGIEATHHSTMAPTLQNISARNLAVDGKNIYSVGMAWKNRGVNNLYQMIMKIAFHYMIIGQESTYYDGQRLQPCHFWGIIGLISADWPEQAAVRMNAGHGGRHDTPSLISDHVTCKKSISTLFSTHTFKTDIGVQCLHNLLKYLKYKCKFAHVHIEEIQKKFGLAGHFTESEFPLLLNTFNGKFGSDTFHSIPNVLKPNAVFHFEYITQGHNSQIRQKILGEIVLQFQQQCNMVYMNKIAINILFKGKSAHKLRSLCQLVFFLYFALFTMQTNDINYVDQYYNQQQYSQLHHAFHLLLIISAVLNSSFYNWQSFKQIIKLFDMHAHEMQVNTCKIKTKSKSKKQKQKEFQNDIEEFMYDSAITVYQKPSYALLIEIILKDALLFGSPLNLSCDPWEASLKNVKLAAKMTSWAKSPFKLVYTFKRVKNQEHFYQMMIAQLFCHPNPILLSRMPKYIQKVILSKSIIQGESKSIITLSNARWIKYEYFANYYFDTYITQNIQFIKNNNCGYVKWLHPMAINIPPDDKINLKCRQIHLAIILLLKRFVPIAELPAKISLIMKCLSNKFIKYEVKYLQNSNRSTVQQIIDAQNKADILKKKYGGIAVRTIASVDVNPGCSLHCRLHSNDFVYGEERLHQDQSQVHKGMYKILSLIQFEGILKFVPNLPQYVENETVMLVTRWSLINPLVFNCSYEQIPNLFHVKVGQFAEFNIAYQSGTHIPQYTLLYTKDIFYQCLPVSICNKININQWKNYRCEDKTEDGKIKVSNYGIHNIDDYTSGGCFLSAICTVTNCNNFPCKLHMKQNVHAKKSKMYHTCKFNIDSRVYLISTWQGLILHHIRTNPSM